MVRLAMVAWADARDILGRVVAPFRKRVDVMHLDKWLAVTGLEQDVLASRQLASPVRPNQGDRDD